MKCPNCRAVNQPYAHFCLDCGEPLAGDELRAPSYASRSTAPATPFSLRELLSRRRLELVVGVVLLVTVLAVGIFDALRQEKVTTAYRAGISAEDGRHWDAAVSQFLRAEDHRDASRRAENARTVVHKRDGLYQAALKATTLADWGRARLLFGMVRDIEPDYGDVGALYAAARQEETSAGITGIFYLSTGPGKPGIYRKSPLGTQDIYLAGSDGNSGVLLLSADGNKVVYSAGRGMERSLFFARFADRFSLEPSIFPLPATFDSDTPGRAGTAGFWWRDAVSRTMVYVDYETLAIAPVSLLDSGWQIYAYDTRRDRLILGNRIEEGQFAHTRMVLANAVGGETKPVANLDGIAHSVQLSPDGRWLLYQQEQRGSLASYRDPGSARGYTTYWRRGGDSSQTLSIILTDLDIDATTPFVIVNGRRVLRERLLDYMVMLVEGASENSFITRFAPNGDTTYIVADRRERDSRRVTIYEPASGLQTTFWPDPPPANSTSLPIFSPPGESVLLQSRVGEGVRLRLQSLDNPVRQDDLQVELLQPDLVIPMISLRDSHLLYAVTRPRTDRVLNNYTLYSVPLDGDNGFNGEPAVLLTAHFSQRSVQRQLRMTLAPGGDLLLYINPDGELWAVSLDGSLKLRLAEGARRVWGPETGR